MQRLEHVRPRPHPGQRKHRDRGTADSCRMGGKGVEHRLGLGSGVSARRRFA